MGEDKLQRRNRVFDCLEPKLKTKASLHLGKCCSDCQELEGRTPYCYIERLEYGRSQFDSEESRNHTRRLRQAILAQENRRLN